MNEGQRKILVWTLWGIAVVAAVVAFNYWTDRPSGTNPIPWLVGAIVFAGLGFFVRAGGRANE